MKPSLLILFLGTIAAFVFGVIHLFNVRFEAGDVYPPYSSLRADPLGTKALYESFAQLVPASRNLQRWSKLDEGTSTTLFYLGVPPENLEMTRNELRQLEAFVSSGGRLVISLVTRYKESFRASGQKTDDREMLVDAAEHWGVQFAYARLPKEDDQYLHPIARKVDANVGLPVELPWHSAVYFDKVDPAWRPIYVISNDLPVLIERSLGLGQIVLSSDSYMFSNEALLEPSPNLLSWFAGSAKAVIFDETHLGVREDPGLATLFRRYRLHGAVAALLVMAALFIWKSSDALVPPMDATASQADRGAVAGRAAASGFVNLLRRNVRLADLIALCISEWKRSQAPRVAHGRLSQIQAIIDSENQLPASRRDPLRIYRSISQVLAKRTIS